MDDEELGTEEIADRRMLPKVEEMHISKPCLPKVIEVGERKSVGVVRTSEWDAVPHKPLAACVEEIRDEGKGMKSNSSV